MEEMRSVLPLACASAAEGRRSTAMELVMAEGKKIKGIAILVRTPYRDRAWESVRP